MKIVCNKTTMWPRVAMTLPATLLLAALAGCAGEPARQIVPTPKPVEAEAPTVDDAPDAGAAATEGGAEALAAGQVRVIEAVAMSVNGHTVTTSDIFTPLRRQLRQIADEAADQREFLSRAGEAIIGEINRQVDQLLVSQRAESSFKEGELAFVDTQVDNQLRDLLLASGGSQVKFEADLAAQGLTLGDLRRGIRRDLLTHFYIRRHLLDRLSFTRGEMLRYYQQHADDYASPGGVRMRIMAFPYASYLDVPPSMATEAMRQTARDKALAAASAARKKVEQGGVFAEIVKSDSPTGSYRSAEGGLWNLLTPGSFREQAVEAAALAQEIGALSEPIAGDSGVFLVETVEKQSASTTSFEQAQPDILEKLKDRRYAEIAGEFFKKLREQADLRHGEAFQQYALHLAAEIFYTKTRDAGTASE